MKVTVIAIVTDALSAITKRFVKELEVLEVREQEENIQATA